MNAFGGFNKGVNLGGWLSQNELTKEHLDTFISEADIAAIKNMGADHVRVPMDYIIIEDEDGCPKEDGYTYIDNCIKWCKDNQLNMVLDLHKTAGYIFDDSENCKGFFYDKELQDRFINIWDRLSKRYGSYSDMVAFELLNEVVDPDVAEIWNELAERAIKAIRVNAPDTWILIGGTRNNSIVSLSELKAPYDNRIVFNFHCYEPLIFTHQAAYWVKGMTPDFRVGYPKTLGEYEKLSRENIGDYYSELITGYENVTCNKDFFVQYFSEAVELSKKYDVPLYCGEYGVIDQAATDGILNWFKDIHAAFEECGIGRAVWSYKEMDFGITDEHYSDIAKELINYL